MPSLKAIKQQQSRSVSRNAAAQMLGRILYLATRVALPPFILHYISMEEYGIWATCWIIIGYVGMGAFGVSNVYVRYVAEYNATHRYEKIGPLLCAGLTLTTTFGAITLLGLWFGLPWVYVAFKISPNLQATAGILIFGTVATMLLDMTFGAFAYVLQGMQKITEQTAVWIASYLLETLLMVAMMMQGWGVTSLLWAFVGRYLLATVVYAILCYRAIPGLKIRLSGVRLETFHLFFRYGGMMQISGLLSVFLYSCERLVAGTLTGISAVVLLDIGQKFPMMSTQVFSSATNSLLTALTHHHSLNQKDEMIRLYLRGSRYLNLLNGCALGFMAPFAVAIITAWVGDDPAYHEAGIVFVCAAAGYHLHALTGPASTYFQGISNPGGAIWGYLIPQLILLGAGLVGAYAVLGHTLIAVIAAATGARMVSSGLFLLYANSQLGVRQWRWLWQALLPGLAPYAVGYGLAVASQGFLGQLATGRLVLIPALAALAAVYAILLLAILYAVFSQPEERQTMKRLMGRIIPSLQKG
jgi:O-antigen/teichoic acid export membrane protein